MGFKIVVDSCTDPTPAMRTNPVFSFVPLTIHCGQSVFVDDENLSQAELLATMKANEQAPSTACPSPQAYVDAMDCGVEDVYVVTLSALLSGSYNSAEQGKKILQEEKPDVNVHVFNSCSAVSGQTRIALKVQELAESGMAFDALVSEVEKFIAEMQTLFVLENLENLRKNGRLSRLQAVVTGALKIRLFMHATPQGEIGKLGQALSTKQALDKLVSRMAADVKHMGKLLVMSQCNCYERALELKAKIESKCNFKDIIIIDTAGIGTVYAYDGGIVCAY